MRTQHTNIKYKKLTENAIEPSRGSEYAAGADLFAAIEGGLLSVDIKPGETVLVHTGIAIEIPRGQVGLIFARSGISVKRGLAPANKVGVIDSDYRGEILVALHNHSGQTQTVLNGERIAQIAFVPFLVPIFVKVEKLSETVRGIGGFGSTGKK